MGDQRPEIVYMQTPDTFVSSTRAVLNGVTYAMANVTSVRMHTVKGESELGKVLLAVGACVVVSTLCVQSLWTLGGGLAVMILSQVLRDRAHPTFVVALGTAGGESHAQESHQREGIQATVDAISRAIVERG